MQYDYKRKVEMITANATCADLTALMCLRLVSAEVGCIAFVGRDTELPVILSSICIIFKSEVS